MVSKSAMRASAWVTAHKILRRWIMRTHHNGSNACTYEHKSTHRSEHRVCPRHQLHGRQLVRWRRFYCDDRSGGRCSLLLGACDSAGLRLPRSRVLRVRLVSRRSVLQGLQQKGRLPAGQHAQLARCGASLLLAEPAYKHLEAAQNAAQAANAYTGPMLPTAIP